jgi:hypothetical protein
VDLAEYLDLDINPDPDWPINGLRLFVSHSGQPRETFEQLRAEFEYLHANFFLAPVQIPGGEVWRPVLLRALRSMDVLISVHSNGFSQSAWANQEIGFALARDVPIEPIQNGELPTGFLAQIQGHFWQVGQERQLVQSIFTSLNQRESLWPKLGEGPANALKASHSYAESDRIVAVLLNCRRFSDRALRAINLACSFNDQVYESGAVAQLSQLFIRLGYVLTLSPQVWPRCA